MTNKHGKLSQERSSSHGFWATHQENDSLRPSPPINVPKVTINTLLFGVCVSLYMHQLLAKIYALFTRILCLRQPGYSPLITLLPLYSILPQQTMPFLCALIQRLLSNNEGKKETQIRLQGKWSRVRGPFFGFLKLFSFYYLKFFEINFFNIRNILKMYYTNLLEYN